MLNRIIGALRLDPHTFEEVEADSSATKQAVLVVVIVAIASGIGGLGGGFTGLIIGVVSAIVQWALWAFITFVVGTTIFKTPETHANWGQLARTTGFAQAPGLLKILGFIPFLGVVIIFIASVWQLVAMVIAVRHALDYTSTWRAVGVVLVGAVIIAILNIIMMSIIGGSGAPTGAL